MSMLERSMQVLAPIGRHIEALLGSPATLHGVEEGVTVAARAASGADHVVLVAGYSSIPEYLHPLQRTLIADGYAVHIATIPQNGLGDARTAADLIPGLVDAIRTTDRDAAIHLVGHSRGGMIARDAMVRHFEPGDINSLIVLGSPQNGVRIPHPELAKSRIADFFMPQSRLQLLEGSDYVKSLAARPLHNDGAHLASIYVNRFDGAVRPAEAHVSEQGWRNIAVNVPGPMPHVRMMTNDSATYRQLANELQMSRSLRQAAAAVA